MKNSIISTFYSSIRCSLLRVGQTSFSHATSPGSRRPGRICYHCSVLLGSASGSPSRWTCSGSLYKIASGRHPVLMWKHLNFLNVKTVNPALTRLSISSSISSSLVSTTLSYLNLNNCSLGAKTHSQLGNRGNPPFSCTASRPQT